MLTAACTLSRAQVPLSRGLLPGKVDVEGLRMCCRSRAGGLPAARRRRIASFSSVRKAAVLQEVGQTSGKGITLYTARSTYPALNGWKLTILLEELKELGRLPEGFEVVELDLGARQHKEAWFLEINPNGRIPALVDHERGNLAIFESGAMMLYLAESRGSGCLLPEAVEQKYRVLQWLFFQVSGIGPIQGQAHAFLRYVPEEVPYAQRRFVNETARLYSVLDEALSKGGPYIAGDYSIADIALYPWVEFHAWAGQSLDGLPSLERWREMVASRPGVVRGMAYNKKDINELLANSEAVRQAVKATTLDDAGPAKP
eukprot:TRINITY_DN27852_c0_g1_i1.p1 TRINITY_DN27852_c0_g1~~TRINITY_DN27852_c0_g1_i1.p1  ORF type:complete len:330 (+),score=77.97 TRINITY_DN27852_c0_g1_i1:48-992(+)